MNGPDFFLGFHKVKFSEVLANHGWDLAYDLDAHMKTLDRPGVPRLLPHIRLNREGHPATARHEENGRGIPKTLASMFCPGFCVIKAIYDPNYEDVDYRYRWFSSQTHKACTLAKRTMQAPTAVSARCCLRSAKSGSTTSI